MANIVLISCMNNIKPSYSVVESYFGMFRVAMLGMVRCLRVICRDDVLCWSGGYVNGARRS